MLIDKTKKSIAAIVAAGALAACGATQGTEGSLSLSIDDTGSVVATAESATGTTADGTTLRVGEGEVLIISPTLSDGIMTVTLADGDETVLEESVSGTEPSAHELDAGDYAVSVSVPEGTTASGTVTLTPIDPDTTIGQIKADAIEKIGMFTEGDETGDESESVVSKVVETGTELAKKSAEKSLKNAKDKLVEKGISDDEDADDADGADGTAEDAATDAADAKVAKEKVTAAGVKRTRDSKKIREKSMKDAAEANNTEDADDAE